MTAINQFHIDLSSDFIPKIWVISRQGVYFSRDKSLIWLTEIDFNYLGSNSKYF